MSCNQSSLWMHSNLHLLFWDKRRDKKSKGNQSTPSFGNLFSMGNRCAEWPGGFITIAEFVFLSLLWSILTICYQFESILNSRSAQIVVLMKRDMAFNCGHMVSCTESNSLLLFSTSFNWYCKLFWVTIFSLQTCGSCGNELSKCPVCRKRIKIRIPGPAHPPFLFHGVEI